MTDPSKQAHQLQKHFLLGSLILLLYLLYQFISPFLVTVFVAGIVAVSVSPLHKLILSKAKSNIFAAFITLLLVFILFLIPISFFIIAIINQATDAYLSVSEQISIFVQEEKDFLSVLDKYPLLQNWAHALVKNNPVSLESIALWISDSIRVISTFLLEHSSNIIKQISLFVIHFLIFILALFYFIKDGSNLTQYLQSIIPLPENYTKELFQKIDNLMNSLVMGTIASALAQGIALGIGLAIIDIPNAIFWGALGGVFSPVPYVGVGLIWVPITISLFISGNAGSGVFMIIWGSVIVSQVDNIIKPYLIGARSTLHPFAVMIMILGGALAFGAKGLIFGPFILMLTLSFLHIYSIEFSDALMSQSPKNPIPKKSFIQKVETILTAVKVYRKKTIKDDQ